MENVNYLIIGSGIAGLSLAIHLAEYFPEKRICILTKSDESKSNTQFAQGGIAVVTNFEVDSFEKHIKDTLLCGSICDKEVVESVVKEGPKRLQEIIDWGAQFDKNKNQKFDLGKEGGHSEHRVIHHKDQTGREIANTMLKYIQHIPAIQLINHHFVLDLLVNQNTCYGAVVLNENTQEITNLYAENIVLATGGIGQVYGHTTNSEIATGDGVAMAHKNGAIISDMEFIQFHPTAMYSNKLDTTFLISEAVRGFGAYLRTKNGERFMHKYDSRLELAPRDIVSQSIYKELSNRREDCVYLDCTHLDIDAFKKHFPMIYEQCKQIHILIEKDWIPVAPSQHYLCGGIRVNMNGESSIQNLFVCGESARTGLHGANRLASNSLLEALVYSNHIFNHLKTKKNQYPKLQFKNFSVESNQLIKTETLNKYRNKLNQIMMKYVGIIRSNKELEIAKNELIKLYNEVLELTKKHYPTRPLYELRNMFEVGLLVVEHSLVRKDSIGTFIKINSAS